MMKLCTRLAVTGMVLGIIWFPFILTCDLKSWACSIDLHQKYKKPLEEYKKWKKSKSACEASECSSQQ